MQGAPSQARFAWRQLFEGYRIDSAGFATSVFGVRCWPIGCSFLPRWRFDFGLSGRIRRGNITSTSSFRGPFICHKIIMVALCLVRLAVWDHGDRVAVGKAPVEAIRGRIGYGKWCRSGDVNTTRRESIHSVDCVSLWVRVGHHVVRRRVGGHGSNVEPRGTIGNDFAKLSFGGRKLVSMKSL